MTTSAKETICDQCPKPTYVETPTRAEDVTTVGTPEPRFPCENESVGLENGVSHYRDTGYTAGELRFARFEIREYQTVYGGFWCPSCLQGLNIKPKGATLEQYLEYRAGKQAAESACKEIRALLAG